LFKSLCDEYEGANLLGLTLIVENKGKEGDNNGGKESGNVKTKLKL